jgi:hypothetical protein
LSGQLSLRWLEIIFPSVLRIAGEEGISSRVSDICENHSVLEFVNWKPQGHSAKRWHGMTQREASVGNFLTIFIDSNGHAITYDNLTGETGSIPSPSTPMALAGVLCSRPSLISPL